MADVLARIEQIFRDVLDDEALELSRETAPVSLPAWDSLAHVNVLFSVEEEFGVHFSTSEFKRLTTVGDLADALATKGVTSKEDR
jgi:acyl carrier protein